ncbi:MAG: nickel pincer cofactor biosynthesis protein LarC [Moorea sp. SIO4E2]|uniref:nickel pincer cofactor biosynthesis protein LarC n=1 Tax=Moorena sp. SIO4E2 TaxID=2607826 RepID=UPI0013B7D082|nr:nickel pincer cofactor biosynthesis protein LarC [Moorena sp. SIO4E2]NEQ06659.1 nickel pincer cofactor biosynthesis protein LarC [Moorena sp. SIO4E2]
MTKLAYLDCPTGIAGDMCLGALVSAGVPWEYLVDKLAGLGIEQEYHLRLSQVHHNGQLATKVDVDLPDQNYKHDHHQQEHGHEHHHEHGHEHHHQHRSGITEISTPEQNHNHHPTRHLPDIEKLITAGKLPSRVSQWTLAIFRKLAEAEGAVHGISPDKVHFHEVGATDAIIDIVGTCLGLDWLGIDQIYCSPLPTGGGTVWAAHGRLPVPVPAVLKLWESRQVPVYSNGIERELVTPTGAAIAVTLATSFGSPPAMTIQKIGNGAGSRQLPIPNMLRLWIGESSEAVNVGKFKVKPSNLPPQTLHQSPLSANSSSANSSLETISVLETQIDDLNPQAIGYVFQELFNAGAVDVFTQAIGMKKSRPGILLSVICHPQDLDACQAVLFRETTTLGVRRLTQQRAILPREIQQVQTKYGQISVKVAWSDRSPHKTIMNVHPEYQDCAKLAKENNCSWLEVHHLALSTWYSQHQAKGAGSRE